MGNPWCGRSATSGFQVRGTGNNFPISQFCSQGPCPLKGLHCRPVPSGTIQICGAPPLMQDPIPAFCIRSIPFLISDLCQLKCFQRSKENHWTQVGVKGFSSPFPSETSWFVPHCIKHTCFLHGCTIAGVRMGSGSNSPKLLILQQH